MGLLSEGYLRLRFGGLIFGRAYFFGGLIIGILRYYKIPPPPHPKKKKERKKKEHVISLLIIKSKSNYHRWHLYDRVIATFSLSGHCNPFSPLNYFFFSRSRALPPPGYDSILVSYVAHTCERRETSISFPEPTILPKGSWGLGTRMPRAHAAVAQRTETSCAQLFKAWITYSLDKSQSNTANIIPFDTFRNISAQVND